MLKLLLFSLCIFFLFAHASPTASDDDLYSLMEKMMNTMLGMETSWASLANQTVDQIGVMADRILKTEQLILDEGKQIGFMSDRIVRTEQLCANLTTICFHCKASDVSVHSSSIPDTGSSISSGIEPLRRRRPLCVTCMLLNLLNLYHSAGKETPAKDDLMTPFIKFCEHSLELLDEMNSNVTASIGHMEGQIGIMADRIVFTECLIMNMSGQIGTMSDRIVKTEYLMSNMSAKCCNPKPGMKLIALLPVDSAPTQPPFTCPPNSSLSAARGTPIMAQASYSYSPTERTAVSKCNPRDLVCRMLEEMERMAEKIEDEMMSMGVAMLKDMSQGASVIGKLADDIVTTEKLINNMGMGIGQMADIIVEIEKDALELGKEFCNVTFIGEKRVSLDRRREFLRHSAIEVEVLRGQSLLAALTAVRKVIIERCYEVLAFQQEMAAAITLLQRNEKEMVGHSIADYLKLMLKLGKAMGKMVGEMGSVFGHMLDGIKDMSDRIVKTMNDIDSMSQQIVVMEGRMMKTANLMIQLMSSCERR